MKANRIDETHSVFNNAVIVGDFSVVLLSMGRPVRPKR